VVKSLRRNEREIIFDYFLGFATESQINEVQQLLKEHKGAAEFYQKLQSSLEPLDHYSVETCPSHLAEATISRLNAAAQTSQLRLEHLLQNEQKRRTPVTANKSFWSNFVEVAAIAAMIFIVAGISFPTLQAARQNYWKTKCNAQLASIATGISQYAAANDQSLPAVAASAGSPWWKVGYQGNENQSNTRKLWLLVQRNYVEPEAFVCPARIQGKAVKLDRTQVPKLSDFPNRKYVTYSFRIFANNDGCKLVRGNTVLISDVNPVFENLPSDFLKELNIQLNNDQMKANSINHRGKGQNVLFSDGHISFVQSRSVDTTNDDIFTVQNETTYHGNETPASNADAFLAP
jgi:hypothetical protein